MDESDITDTFDVPKIIDDPDGADDSVAMVDEKLKTEEEVEPALLL